MSSEETVSVVGSEVMPLEYGGMDLESSPSSSERTVERMGGGEGVVRGEGVGGGEIVGSGGDSVPIIVVEVEGRGGRCYDVDADIVEEVKQYKPAGVDERTCSAPWDHWMPVYAHYLAARLSLNEDEEEEVGKLIRKGGNLLNIMDLTSAECIEATELYGPSALSEVEMDKFLGTAGGTAIPKKPRKKSKTLTKQVDEEEVGKEVVPSISAEVEEEEEPRLELKKKSREERGALQKKKKLDPKLRQLEEGAEVRAPGKGKGLVPLLSCQSSLFKVNMTGARRFINSTFPEVDKHHARDEALRYCGASVVKHVLEVC
ncbi:hypothetical protein SLEP1_g12575 [Rubroshorea leprosula]|uniref:Uncharacterized protein n=1 Tax=Rubroshorea leprosula TaxID=152421 RepID=A0AAV5ICZ2_9ROSI|nr:hypothetical protein SLEP1_g12575 [Rubroshorea leprosula]